MNLRDLSIWIGCLLVALAAIFAYLVQARSLTFAELEAIAEAERRALVVADRLEKSAERMAHLATDYMRHADPKALQQFENLVEERDGSGYTEVSPFLEQSLRDADLSPAERRLLTEVYIDARHLTVTERRRMGQIHGAEFAFNPAAKARFLAETASSTGTMRDKVLVGIGQFRTQVAARYHRQRTNVEMRLQAITDATIGTFVAIQIAALAALVYFATNILPGFERIRVALQTTAAENFDTPVEGITRQDEVGDMARAVVSLQQNGQARTAALSKLAYFDALTGLANRAVFRERLSAHLQSVEPGTCVAVFMLDLDKFKEINDVYGHPAGDIVLKETARRLGDSAGRKLKACRFGGDEFGIVGVLANELEAIALGQIILRRLCKPINVSNRTVVTCGCTIGLAVTKVPIAPDRIISRADMALYKAKEAGRGQLMSFQEGMDASLMERRELEEDLRRASARNELRLALQPQVDLHSHETVGFEALMRWDHPTRGSVSPGAFIPIAEESRLILEIGRWSIEEACRLATKWPETVKISVNLSTAQFYDTGLVPFVEDTIAQAGIAPERIEIEVTETVLIDDRALAFRIMHELRSTGVGLALDDFGTGFSSLSYLREFPFDKIKIDQSFVAAMEEGGTARSIVRSIIGLGKALGMEVIAEGVETVEQNEMLKDDGCDVVQGYLFGKAVPAEEAMIAYHRGYKNTFEAFEADSREEAMETARSLAGKRGSNG